MKIALAFLFALLLISCGTQTLPDAPENTSTDQAAPTIPTPGLAGVGVDGTYLAYGVYQPLDVYVITATVLLAPQSVVQSHIAGESAVYNGVGSGYIQGGTTGKGIVRLHVDGISVSNAYVEKGLVRRDESWKPLAATGDNLIVKFEDTRAVGFIAGDRVTITCREQWEIVGAVGIGEVPFMRNIVREFDLCRLQDGHIIPAPTPEQ
jgi:hypothetical protein